MSNDRPSSTGRYGRPEYRSDRAPAYRACWDDRIQLDLYRFCAQPADPEASAVMRRSLDCLRVLRDGALLLGEDGFVRTDALSKLADAGYWRLLIEPQFGGCGGSFRSFAPFLTQVSAIQPAVAGLGSIHGCIGAAALLSEFGNDDQKTRLLPPLVRGDRLSAFALSEPGAGTDLTSLSTSAKLSKGHYLLSGEKLFITNLRMGRTLVVICRVQGEPAAMICELPEDETSQCRLTRYGLHVLKHTPNHGILFDDFPVPVENQLIPPQGNGLTIAYHGLNRGRVALCALASGRMRILLANLVPWCKQRRTYGAAIGERELVLRRLGRLAARIAACDALVAWTSSLLDQGYRGELECIVAKIFGSEALRFAAVDVFMKTHGGRSFLQGHLFGDDVHDYLAPCIYEGEGEMLGLALFRGLAKGYGRPPSDGVPPDAIDRQPSGAFQGFVSAAEASLAEARGCLIQTVERYGESLMHRQCRMAEISERFQAALVTLCTALSGDETPDPILRLAARVMCQELSGEGLSDQAFMDAAQLGRAVMDGEFNPIAGISAEPILRDPGSTAASVRFR